MFKALALITVASGAAWAGADPDLYRKVPEGQVVYTGSDVEVGKTYQGFLIRFVDRDQTFLSPSRFRVSYVPEALQCRNLDEHKILPVNEGKWHTVSFEVHAVKETATESPAGSGNWGWTQTFDCTVHSLEITQ